MNKINELHDTILDLKIKLQDTIFELKSYYKLSKISAKTKNNSSSTRYAIRLKLIKFSINLK